MLEDAEAVNLRTKVKLREQRGKRSICATELRPSVVTLPSALTTVADCIPNALLLLNQTGGFPPLNMRRSLFLCNCSCFDPWVCDSVVEMSAETTATTVLPPALVSTASFRAVRPSVAGPDTPEPPFPIRLEGYIQHGFGRGGRDLGCHTGMLQRS